MKTIEKTYAEIQKMMTEFDLKIKRNQLLVDSLTRSEKRLDRIQEEIEKWLLNKEGKNE